MTNVLIHDARRLVLPLDTMVDALIEFDQAHKRWPERAKLETARLVPSGVVVSVTQSAQDAPIERNYSLPLIAAAIIHYCAKMRVPVPKNASKSVSVTPDGITMTLEGTLFLQRQHQELPPQGIASPQVTEPVTEPVTEQAIESAVDQAAEPSAVPAAEVASPAPSAPSPAAQPQAASAALDADTEGQKSEHSTA